MGVAVKIQVKQLNAAGVEEEASERSIAANMEEAGECNVTESVRWSLFRDS